MNGALRTSVAELTTAVTSHARERPGDIRRF
jgi:hypothetical protein